jgi:erythromycin esterase-like protein
MAFFASPVYNISIICFFNGHKLQKVLRALAVIVTGLSSACAPAASDVSQKQYVLADPGKYRTEQEKALAKQSAENDCKAKAIAASAAVHKTLVSDKQENLGTAMHARDKENAMYDATFTSCMNKAGYLLQ